MTPREYFTIIVDHATVWMTSKCPPAMANIAANNREYPINLVTELMELGKKRHGDKGKNSCEAWLNHAFA